MVTAAERREHSRSRIDWPVSVYHPRLGMFINGRSVNVSRSGAKISLPVAVPVRPGQIVELNFPRTTMLAKVAGCFSRIKTARVVRIDGEPAAAPTYGDVEIAGLQPEPDSLAAFAPPATLLATVPKAAPAKRKGPRRQMVAVHFDKHALTGTDQ